MRGKINKVELMSPAGDMVCLNAAIKGGANAVYLGLKGSNMRAGAKNFSLGELKQACKICAKNNVKTYLTINTIYYENELGALKKTIENAANAGVDAFIAWDNAALGILKDMGLNAFLSTQASVSNSQAILQYYKNFGIKRFVLARECTLEHIKAIRRNLKKALGATADEISIEVFAHGAMCVSVSGRCFLSEFMCGKSANRGECLQPCRRLYKISDTSPSGIEYELGNNYVLSPKDLCALPFLDLLLDAKVNSLKIEGRNRNAEFVYETTRAYRTVIDAYYAKMPKAEFEALKKEQTANLQNVFNRGFSEGFFMGVPLKDWHSNCSGNKSKQKKQALGRITNFFGKISVAEIQLNSGNLKRGQLLQVEGEKTGFVRFAANSMQIDLKDVDFAKKGQKVAVKCPHKLRRGDNVYTFTTA